ncbi:MFS transporter [Promethearchaeum syntrophicum]|uniref:MFS transporter n=1 Tax=Promethearchaeum syntrophicum TaxID=2594042 RepID=A0A5B9D5K2_9ARCH|nr:MFS transporter [Candidatus Prometheoarchaeum syntrophicum]QEE14325.1 drug efflux system protein MdtG [Candidatus Prometheoarchaeum syntrophicum]
MENSEELLKNQRDLGTTETYGQSDQLNNIALNQKLVLFTLGLCLFVDIMGYSMVLPLLPSFATNLGASPFTIGLIISMNAIVTMIFSPLWGKLSDKVGRIIPLIISQIGTVISFILLAFSSNITLIFVSRILDGIFGGQAPIVNAYFSDVTNDRDRHKKMGLLFFGVSLGIIIGPAIGGLLGNINWAIPCLLAALFGTGSIFLTKKYLPENNTRNELINHNPPIRPTQQKKLLKSELSEKRKIFILILSEIFFVNFAFSIINSSLPVYLDIRFDVSADQIGILYTLIGIEMMIFSLLIFKRLIGKFGEKRIFLFANIGMICSFIIFPYLDRFWMIYLFMFFNIFFIMSIKPIIQLRLAKKIPSSSQGSINGWAVNSKYLPKIFAPLITTYYLEIEFLGRINSYFLIGLTSAIIGIMLLALFLLDSGLDKKKSKNESSQI